MTADAIPLATPAQGRLLKEVLKEVTAAGIVKVYFREEWIDGMVIDADFSGRTLIDVLAYVFRGTDLRYFWLYPNHLIITRDLTGLIVQEKVIAATMREEKEFDRVTIGRRGESKESQYRILGTLLSAETGELITSGSIEVAGTDQRTVTDIKGAFVLNLSPGRHTLVIRALDYETEYLIIDLFSNGSLAVSLGRQATLLEEVLIQAETTRPISQLKVGEVQLSVGTLKTSPVLLGEADLVKEIQTLPGVTSVGEAAGGFNVRGGSVDQNLILLDRLPIYNSSHLFGFFSTVNAEAIQSATFFTGGIPARYGGRNSSVLDISLKTGDGERWKGSGGLGIMSSNFALGGPIRKNKTTLYTAFRTSYSNWLVQSIRTNYVDLRQTSARFLDGSIKMAHTFDEKTKATVTAYSSWDALRLSRDTTFQWATTNIGTSLQYQWRPGFYGDFSFGLASYKNAILNNNPANAVGVSYSITSVHLAGSLHHSERKSHIRSAGIELSYFHLDPGMARPLSAESSAKTIDLPSQNSLEIGLFAQDEWQVSEQFTIEAGVRLPVFLTIGPGTVRRYATDDLALENIVDTVTYAPLSLMAAFVRLEPRFSGIWRLSASSSIKFGYQRVNQFLHLASNTAAVSPIDAWQISNDYLRPQSADQLSLGLFRDFLKTGASLSAEAFYKSAKNIVEFKDGANLLMNAALESDLLQGRGRAYGMELMARKNMGRLTGSINYTLSRSVRQVAGNRESETINGGRWYPSNFDQPNILNASYKYQLSKRHYVSGQFTYHTGRPVTIPVSVFEVEGGYVSLFSDRNQYRIKDYHRLDLAFVIEGNHRKTKRFKSTWVFSVYNVYGRENPYSVFFKPSSDGSLPQPNQLSVIGTVLPSVTYTMRFE